MQDPRNNSWRRKAVIAVLGLGLLGLATFEVLLTAWSEVGTLTPQAAAAERMRLLEGPASGPALLSVDDSGQISVTPSADEPSPDGVARLSIWSTREGGETVLVAYPMWFVTLRTGPTVNLGTLMDLVVRDLRVPRPSVTLEALENRGPGLVLDHSDSRGGHLLIWTE